jgi:hypothetical protein
MPSEDLHDLLTPQTTTCGRNLQKRIGQPICRFEDEIEGLGG